MTKAAIWSVIITATTCVFAGLFFFRGVLTQLALAAMLWLAIESVAVHFRRWLPPRYGRASVPLAFLGIVLIFGVVGYEVIVNVGSVATQASVYERRLDLLIAESYHAAHIGASPPTIAGLLASINLSSVLFAIAGAIRSFAGETIFILIYLAFMFSAAHSIHHKLDKIFPDAGERAHVREVLSTIRRLMAQYLWVQTILASLVGVATWLTLLACGLHNALFWGVLAFFLNFIPTVGPIGAVVLPILFAIVQYQTFGPVLAVGGGLVFWQFLIANVVQPRMMSDSLNLSALVVLLSLAIWGLLWGIAGALLSAPLTVMVMIVLAQFSNTRWVAILLSEDGEPGGPRIHRGGRVKHEHAPA